MLWRSSGGETSQSCQLTGSQGIVTVENGGCLFVCICLLSIFLLWGVRVGRGGFRTISPDQRAVMTFSSCSVPCNATTYFCRGVFGVSRLKELFISLRAIFVVFFVGLFCCLSIGGDGGGGVTCLVCKPPARRCLLAAVFFLASPSTMRRVCQKG